MAAAEESVPARSFCKASRIAAIEGTATPCVLLLLNSPDEVDHRLVEHFMRKCDAIVFGDGGWGRYGGVLDRLAGVETKVIGVIGDFDSGGAATSAASSVSRIEMPSQDANDMFKCLATIIAASEACQSGTKPELPLSELYPRCNELLSLPAPSGDKASTKGSLATAGWGASLACGPTQLDVVVVGALGGRYDHTAQSINALVCWTHNFNSLWLLNNHSYVTLVNPPAAFVALHPGLDGPTCGILPVGTPPSTVTTTGLRWNLSPALKLQYGGIVSSSNHAEESTIGITTDAKILFTAELHLEACIKAIATSLAPQ